MSANVCRGVSVGRSSALGHRPPDRREGSTVIENDATATTDDAELPPEGREVGCLRTGTETFVQFLEDRHAGGGVAEAEDPLQPPGARPDSPFGRDGTEDVIERLAVVA